MGQKPSSGVTGRASRRYSLISSYRGASTPTSEYDPLVGLPDCYGGGAYALLQARVRAGSQGGRTLRLREGVMALAAGWEEQAFKLDTGSPPEHSDEFPGVPIDRESAFADSSSGLPGFALPLLAALKFIEGRGVMSDDERLLRMRQSIQGAEDKSLEELARSTLCSAHWVLMFLHLCEWYPGYPSSACREVTDQLVRDVEPECFDAFFLALCYDGATIALSDHLPSSLGGVSPFFILDALGHIFNAKREQMIELLRDRFPYLSDDDYSHCLHGLREVLSPPEFWKGYGLFFNRVPLYLPESVNMIAEHEHELRADSRAESVCNICQGRGTGFHCPNAECRFQVCQACWTKRTCHRELMRLMSPDVVTAFQSLLNGTYHYCEDIVAASGRKDSFQPGSGTEAEAEGSDEEGLLGDLTVEIISATDLGMGEYRLGDSVRNAMKSSINVVVEVECKGQAERTDQALAIIKDNGRTERAEFASHGLGNFLTFHIGAPGFHNLEITIRVKRKRSVTSVVGHALVGEAFLQVPPGGLGVTTIQLGRAGQEVQGVVTLRCRWPIPPAPYYSTGPVA